MFAPLVNKIIFSILISLTIVSVAVAHPKDDLRVDAAYATGVVVGESVGTGLFVRKYFDRNYVQVVGRYSYGEESPVSSLAFAVGRYFYQENISRIEFPVGLRYFISTNYIYYHKVDSGTDTSEETRARINPGVGLAIDWFNPGAKGLGVSFSIAYGSRLRYVDEVTSLGSIYLGAVFPSASLVYNW